MRKNKILTKSDVNRILKEQITKSNKRKPSTVYDTEWVYAHSRKKYPTEKNSGKWMIFVYNKDIDFAWERISKATEEGRLGSSSKCSTAMENPWASNRETKVICVYTYDFNDKEDVARIAWEIFQLGVFSSVLNYKTDEVTLEGKYSNKGNTRISTYSVHAKNFEGKNIQQFIDFFMEKYRD